MDFKQSVQTCLGKYAVFEGRASRSELWWFTLAYFLVALVVSLLDGAFGASGVLLALFVLAGFLPMLGVQIRRLHDIGRSGWWFLVDLIPLVGSVVLIVWFCKPGDIGANRFGPDPKEGSPQETTDSRSRKRPESDLDRLEKLHALFERGVLTKEEFEAQKASLLR